MVKSILIAIFLILFVLGICDQIYLFRMLFYRPKIRVSNYMIVTLRPRYALKQLNFLHKKICWYGDEFATGIIAVVDSIDSMELQICNRFCEGKNIILSDLQSLPSIAHLQGEL